MSIKRNVMLLIFAAVMLFFCSCDEKTQVSETDSDDFSGKKIGVLTGSIFDGVAQKYISNPQINYYNSNADLAIALEKGKIDAYVNDKPVWRLLSDQYPDHKIIDQFSTEEYAFIFKKDDVKSTMLCSQMNEFLCKCRQDGTLAQIDSIWFGNDESVKVINMDGLTGENGILSFATTTDIGAPFAYMKDNHFAGYDIDIAVRFCREYGYGIEISNNTFAGMIASVSSGKSSFGAACITITDERKKSILFSDADYIGGNVLVSIGNTKIERITSVEQLSGTRVGVMAGTIFDKTIKKYLPDCRIEYYNTSTDLAMALELGKISSYISDEPVARSMIAETYPAHRILKIFETYNYAFMLSKSNPKSEKLCTELNEFLRKCKADGTLSKLELIWFGSDISKQKIDCSGLTGENGTVSMAICTSNGKPFTYLQDKEYVGYDVDLATRFCAEYGYDLNIVDYGTSGLFTALEGGRCDFGAAGITVTDERKETMIFTDPDYVGGSALVINDPKNLDQITSKEQLAGTRVGVMAGTIFDKTAEKYLPDNKIEYYNTSSDLAMALELGKISSYICDVPVARSMMAETYPAHRILEILEAYDYAFAFPKNNLKSEKLCTEINEFLRRCRTDGTLNKLESIWFGSDISKQKIDRSRLTGENGTVSMAICTSNGKPFTYLQNKEYVGYEIDLATRFCAEYGYDLNLIDYDVTGIFTCLAGGKCDFGAAGITVTEERKENMCFSDSEYVGGSALVVKDHGTSDRITSVKQLAGTRTAVLTGTISDTFARKHIPNCEIEYYNTSADLSVALESGKISSYVTDEPIARAMIEYHPNHRILSILERYDYAFAFPKNHSMSEKLCAEMSEFLKKCKADGTMGEVDAIWFSTDVSKQKIDRSKLTGKNGTLIMATSTAAGRPFSYMQNKEYVGYDIDLATRFCAEYGYGLDIVDYDFSGLFSCLAGGKCDFGAAGITVTKERGENMLFSYPDYVGGSALVVKDGSTIIEDKSFFHSLRDSFNRTFVREDRYLLFLSGIGTTLLIVLLSLVFGSLIGFAIYLIYYRAGKVFRLFVNAIIRITENTPVVVILMILYYVIFGSIGINGMLVSVIGFTLIFSMSVIGLLKVSVDAVDAGQREAALALGYTENKAFMRMILPQAAKHFLPGYKSAIVQLVKGTAIVGYIAVQDLTKVSDIVRSRTYEAFFPLIVTAIIYFFICLLLAAIISCIEINVDPESRKKIKIFNGVKLK